VTRVALFVFGAGGHGRVVSEAARHDAGYDLRGFLDDDAHRREGELSGLPVLDGQPALASLEPGALVALGIGDNRARRDVAHALVARGLRLATVVHPSAVVAGGARLGPGTYVGPLAVLHADAEVGSGCIVNSAAVVEHDCRVGDWAHVSPGAVLGGGVRIGEGAHVGLGAVVLPGLALGEWATLGAGAVMIDSLPAGCVAVGVPARVRSVAAASGRDRR
jgi:sugar O-acyltransferase (sialic acid O-acetyltransferase NeuD family)